ncbi:MAG: T9SS type A sorting domain-containing protein, partial [Bacteroidales bacterium]|nr:T9SS type A sorting domain-containing protein [Bacteroidales bacterium]
LNTVLNPLYANLEDTMTLVKYQMNWPGNGDPYYTEEGGVRRMYYGINSVPAAKLNGGTLNVTNVTSVQASILGEARKKVYFGMWFDTVAIDAAQNVHVVLKVKAVGGMENVRLHTAVMERTTVDNVSSNGETEFHNVMLKMLPDAEGAVVDLVADSVYTFSYTYDMTKTHMEEFNDLRVAAFLQTASGNVLQSVWGNVGSYDMAPGATLAVDYMPTYICADDIPAGLKVVSAGGSPVTSVEVTARVGAAGTPVVQDFDMELNWGESTYRVFPDLKTGAAKGSDTVYFRVTKVNGEPFDGQEVRRAVNVQPTQYAFSPLLEGFTSAAVAGSVALNQYLDAMDEADEDVTILKFPMKGDKYTRTVYTRYAAKLGIDAAPGLALNGYPIRLSAKGALAEEDYFSGLLAQTQKNNSILSIEVDGEVTVGANGTTNVTAKLDFESAVDNSYRLYMIVVESETKLNVGSNGEKQFKRVVQALFPDENGNGMAVRDGKGLYVLSRAIMSSKVENYSNLSLVVVVKDATGSEVLQTAEFPIRNNVANEDRLVYGTLDVYPNPASEYVYLKALENATLDVFDVNGVKVFGLKGVSGDYTLDVQGYTPGVYVVRVQEADKVATARISVVRQ